METIKTTTAENYGGASHSVVPESHQFTLDQIPSLSGKVAVVTGGSEGIGYGCTHSLLLHGIAKLFILFVSKEVNDGVVSAVREEMGEETAQKVNWLQCDMSDWKTVKETADKISSSTDRIDILINNAARGIMTYQLTDHGVDRHMALNHVGHVVLTSCLLPKLKHTASLGDTVRIVNLASNAHQATPSDTQFASLSELNRDLGPNGQYGRSSEDIHEPDPPSGYAMSVAMKPFKKDQFMGCVSAMFAATATTKSGEYICPPTVSESGNNLVQDEELGERLMELTREAVKEETYEDSAGMVCPFEDY